MLLTIRRVLPVVLCLAAFAAAQEGQPEMSEEVKALLQSANAKAQARDAQGALDDVTKALELDPKLAPVWIWSARLKTALKDLEGAVGDFTKAIEINDNIPNAYRLRGLTKQQLKDYEGAAKDFGKAIEKNAQDANSFLNRGQVRELMGDLEGAEKDFSSVCSLAAEFGPAYLSRANIKAALGKYEAALEDFDNAMFLSEGAQKTSVMMSRARTKLLMGDVAGAKKDYKTAAEMSPNNHQVLFSRGLLYYDLGMYKEAVADFRKSLELNAAAHEYGRLYVCLSRMHLGEKDAAEAEMGKYLDERENKDDWFVNVASFLAGRLTEKAFLEAAQDENKNTTREQSCEAYWYAGAKALIAGDKAKAVQFMNLCVTIKVHNFIEYQSSVAALKRLGPQKKPEKKTEKKPEKTEDKKK